MHLTVGEPGKGLTTQSPARADTGKETVMYLGIFAVLVIMWLLGFTMFHVAGGLIHLLLIVAVISLVMHFVGGGRRLA